MLAQVMRPEYIVAKTMTVPNGGTGYETNPKKRPKCQYDSGAQDCGFTGQLNHLGFDPEDSRALERVTLEETLMVRNLSTHNKRVRACSEFSTPLVHLVISPSPDGGEASRRKEASLVGMAIHEINTKRQANYLFKMHSYHVYPPHPSMYDDALDSPWESGEARWFIDGVIMDGERCDPQQHKALQAELFQLSGITPEMISARLATLRAEAGELVQLCPKEYVEQTQLEPGSPREQKARPVLVRYVPHQAENPNDMQTTDGSEQERGQAAAAPAQAQYVVVNIESG